MAILTGVRWYLIVVLISTSLMISWKRLLQVPWTARRSNQSWSKDQSWVFLGRNDAEVETPILWPPHAELTYRKRPWCWEGLGAGGKGDDRGWDGWMASLTWCTWVWVNSGSWWWTGRTGVLWFMGLQRVRHDWVTELNWMISDVKYLFMCVLAICMFYLGRCIFRFFSQFFIWLFLSIELHEVFVYLGE